MNTSTTGQLVRIKAPFLCHHQPRTCGYAKEQFDPNGPREQTVFIDCGCCSNPSVLHM